MIINKVTKESEEKYADAFSDCNTENIGDYLVNKTGNKWLVYCADFGNVYYELNNKPHDCDFEELIRHYAEDTCACCYDVVLLYDNNDSSDDVIITEYINWQINEFEYNEKTIEVEPDVEEMDITPVWLEIADWLRGKTWDEIWDALDDSDYTMQPTSPSLYVFRSESLEFSIEKRNDSIYLNANVVVYDGDNVYEDYTIDDVVDYPLYEPKEKVDVEEFIITENQGMALEILYAALKMCKLHGLKLFVSPDLGIRAYNGNVAEFVPDNADILFNDEELKEKSTVCMPEFNSVIDFELVEEDWGLKKKAA